MSISLEKPERERIMFSVPRGEALVSRVKEQSETAPLERVRDLSPLRVRGINAGGVVSTRVQQYGRAVRRCIKVLRGGIMRGG